MIPPSNRLKIIQRLTRNNSLFQIRGCCEVGLVIWSIIYLIKAVHEFTFLGKRIFLDNMIMCPSRFALNQGYDNHVVDIQGDIPDRVHGLHHDGPCQDPLLPPSGGQAGPRGDDVPWSILSLLLQGNKTGRYDLHMMMNMMKLLQVGPMVIMIYRMMAQDLARFGTVFIIFIMGFSQAFYIIFSTYEFDPEVAEVEEGECDDEEQARKIENCIVSKSAKESQL